MAILDERTLCAGSKSWIDAELQARRYGSLTRAENEVHAQGTRTRHDLLIYAGNRPVFSCEVKVPTSAEGSSPCASFVLWQVDMPGVPIYSGGATDRTSNAAARGGARCSY